MAGPIYVSQDCWFDECGDCGDEQCMHKCHRNDPREPVAIALKKPVPSPASADAHLGARETG